MADGGVGRNDPCPCGSGKKYKKCCLGKEEAGPKQPPGPDVPGEEAWAKWTGEVESELAQLSQWAQEGYAAVERGDFSKAEEMHWKIRDQFPEMIEGPRLLGKLRAAQGRWAEAAAAYQEAIKVIEGDRDGFDDEVLEQMQHRMDEAKLRIPG